MVSGVCHDIAASFRAEAVAPAHRADRAARGREEGARGRHPRQVPRGQGRGFRREDPAQGDLAAQEEPDGAPGGGIDPRRVPPRAGHARRRGQRAAPARHGIRGDGRSRVAAPSTRACIPRGVRRALDNHRPSSGRCGHRARPEDPSFLTWKMPAADWMLGTSPSMTGVDVSARCGVRASH